MISLLVSAVGYMFIFAACDVNRKSESKIPFFSKQWFLQIGLVVMGTLIISSLK